MSDHDRGAYTPQTDPPLAFDPRRPSERRPLPMALIGSAVVLVVLLAGVAMVYRGGVREAGESPRPVGEPVMAVKTAPTGPAAQAPAADAATQQPAAADVYTPANQTAEAPTMAPAPEQPAARPPPSPATVALLSKPPAPTHVVRPAPVAETPAPVQAKAAAKPQARPKVDPSELAAATGGGHSTRVETARTATTQTAAAQSAAATETPASPVKTAKVASATPPRAAPAVAPAQASTPGPVGAAVVQIGAFSSTALADKGYADVSAAVPARMGGKAMHTLALQKDGGTLYRTWVSGFAGRADAVSFCEALKAKGLACFVKGA